MDMHCLLYEKGYKHVARMLRTMIDSRYGRFPNVGRNSGILGWKTGDLTLFDQISRIHAASTFKATVEGVEETKRKLRTPTLLPVWHADTQTWTISARVMETAPDSSMCGGWEQLVRVLCTGTRCSARLDDRSTRKTISFQRRNVAELDGERSTWLPSAHIRL